MFDVTFPRNGALLNRNHGVENADGLKIKVRGICDSAEGTVKVNGVTAERYGMEFSCEVTLKDVFNTIEAELADEYGTMTRTLKVVYDKNSFLRYDFFIDDNIFFLTDIARERPAKLFDHFYLKALKNMHDKYDACFTLNTFFANNHEPFDLTQVPDCYKSEFIDNSDWLRLSFHSYSEFPDRPYQNTNAEKLAADYDLVYNEICRFAGKEAFIVPEVLHWAMARPSTFGELRKRGVRIMEGQFVSPRTGLNDNSGDDRITDVGYYRNINDAIYLEENRYLYDFRYQLLFVRSDCTCNLTSCEDIAEKLGAIQRDTIGVATHEQYTFPRYFNYLPDHLDRIETAVRTLHERGYKSVFFSEGILGNTAWGKDVL